MSISDGLILPADVQLVPVRDLAPEDRPRIDASDQDFAIKRLRLRTPYSVLDKDSAELVESFRAPTRIVDAVLSFAGKRGLDPESTLERAFPVLSRLYQAGMLVPAASGSAEPIEGQLQPGSVVEGFVVIRTVQALDDSEVFLARDDTGRYAAVKYYPSPPEDAIRALEREAELLERIAGGRAPRVFSLFRSGTGIGLATEWVFGSNALTAAGSLRSRGEPCREQHLLALCAEVAAAFADVHESGVLRGNVHPRNVLVEKSGSVRLIGFGHAREIGVLSAQDRPGGVPFYFDPELAQAQRQQRSVAASCAGEQYSVAALVYQMWTGEHYLDWSLEREELLRQIVEDGLVPFQARNVPSWPELEQVLQQALHKDRNQRFPDLRSFAGALSALGSDAQRRDRSLQAAVPKPGPEADLLERMLKRYDLGGEALRDGVPNAPRVSINYGAGGIAYALLRIAQRRADPRYLALADAWSQKAYAWAPRDDAFYNAELQIEPKSVGERSLFHSIAGLHCVRALVSAAQADSASTNAAIRAFIEHSRGPNDGIGRGLQLDAVLGKASLLLGCAELIEAALDSPAFERTAVLARGEELARDIHDALQSGPIEASNEVKFLGVAHGWAGLTFALLRWARATGCEPFPAVRARVEELCALAEPHAAGMRWPVEHGGFWCVDYWCNGSAGYAMLYALAYEALGESRYGELAERAAISAWNSDIALGTLCCGHAGIGYASLAVHRVTGSRQWLERARGCARRAATDRSPHFLPDALYKGAVGVAVLADELDTPEAAAMPLFEPRR